MSTEKLIDHLFRHQYGKMVSVLVRFLGLSNIDLIEDVVQDTFVKAMMAWRTGNIPDKPEAWLMRVAKNRAIDLLRRGKVHSDALVQLQNGPSSIAVNEIFMDHEIEDAQLRMIFTACHPSLKVEDQLTFALKTISGFSNKEIAAALLSNEERIKKSLYRARQKVKSQDIQFKVPAQSELQDRIAYVHQVIYLIFNEGFHSNNKEQLVRKDLCMEAIRLCKIVTDHKTIGNYNSHALMALMCFHSSRLESKVSDDHLILIKDQDRSLWYGPLITMGNVYMTQAVEAEQLSTYHWEAAIAAEHLKAPSFAQTNWQRLVELYDQLNHLAPSNMGTLNKVAVLIQLKKFEESLMLLSSIDVKALGPRQYLFHSVKAECLFNWGKKDLALETIDVALSITKNEAEQALLLRKKNDWLSD